MARLHVAATALVALALLSTFAASGQGGPTAAAVLAAAAGKGVAVLRYFLGIDRATTGWRFVLVGFVLLTCGAAGAVHAVGSLFIS